MAQPENTTQNSIPLSPLPPRARQAVGVTLVIVIGAIGVYGTYLPLRKSRMFIATIRRLNSITTIEEYKNLISQPLDAPSPMGQPELVRQMANALLNLVRQQGANNPALVDTAVSFVERYYAPLVANDYGTGMSQSLYLLGAINETAFAHTQQTRYLEAAEKYFSEGLRRGPKRPQFLYGMFDVYRIKGDVEGARRIGEQILAQWPDDERTREFLAAFLEKRAGETAR